ncbi:hypothetical protein EPICR_20198 [Candidatus Desulfarcum epimagneticum]|uniref:Uncharacterized protein n=1 Tax=uncultured Desulfobacteraceae bacterium TaxID=218296 RepID=A0A484HKF1_9BACT|nr:hypothetical protein EPICR_20198 [uncultured Desulfobacteraceae bacterium]
MTRRIGFLRRRLLYFFDIRLNLGYNMDKPAPIESFRGRSQGDAMRQKYVIEINKKNKMTIQEFAELDKDIMSLLCEEKYDMEEIEAAIAKDESALVDAIRTKNLYPIGVYADKMADAIVELVASPAGEDGKRAKTLLFDDSDLLTRIPEEPDVEDEISDEDVELDDMLDEGLDKDFETEEKIKDIKTSLKVEDDILNVDDSA